MLLIGPCILLSALIRSVKYNRGIILATHLLWILIQNENDERNNKMRELHFFKINYVHGREFFANSYTLLKPPIHLSYLID